MPYIYCFYGRLWSNLLPAHGQRGSKSRRTQKEKMETHLYSLTRFLCLCSRELAMVLNYYAVCKKVCEKLGQSSSQEHSHSDCDTALMNWPFFEVPVPGYNVDALFLATKVALVPWKFVFRSSSNAFDHNQRLCISIPQCCSYVSIWRLK